MPILAPHPLVWPVLGLLTLYNLLVLGFYAYDKRSARLGRWRVPESRLLWLAACFGGAGALVGIFVLRHKTRHRRFAWGVPCLAILQVLILGALYGVTAESSFFLPTAY